MLHTKSTTPLLKADMEADVIRQIQREGAEALLDLGVSVPLKAIRIPFKKTPLVLRVTMKRPCMSGQLRIARTYLSMGVTSEQMWNFTKEEEMQFLVKHGKKVSRMIAYMICRGYLARKFGVWLTAWFIRNFMTYEYQMEVMKKFVTLMGTDPFIPIIRSAEMSNPMKLRLSRKKKGS